MGETSKAVAKLRFFITAERKKRGKKVGAASTFFPLLFHRGNPQTHCGTSKIRSASITSTKSHPPPRHRALPAVRALLPLCRQISFLWGSNLKAAEKPTVGAVSGNLRSLPLRWRVFPDFSLGQAERLAVRLPHPPTLKGEPGGSPDPLYNTKREELNVRKPKTKPNFDHPGDGR